MMWGVGETREALQNVPGPPGCIIQMYTHILSMPYLFTVSHVPQILHENYRGRLQGPFSVILGRNYVPFLPKGAYHVLARFVTTYIAVRTMVMKAEVEVDSKVDK
jgi:hypothetical protein